MEVFSLLKYWRSGDGGGGGCYPISVVEQDSASTPTIVTAAVSPCSSDGEGGPYFDLEFTLPEDHESDADQEDQTTLKYLENDDARTSKTGNGEETEDGSYPAEGSEHEHGGVHKFSVDESSSILLDVTEETSYSSFPVISLLKSATKIRVLLLKLKRPKSEKSENNGTNGGENVETVKIQEKQSTQTSGKFLTVKLQEKQGKVPKDKGENLDLDLSDKKLIQKYLKMVKPLYIRVSKRYVDKLKFAGQLGFSGSKGGGGGGAASSPPFVAAVGEEVPAEAAAERVKTIRVTDPLTDGVETGARVVQKQLGKSRSASAAVVASPPVKTAAHDRRDDSLLQVQDGIEDAILHCKRSFQRL